MFITQLLAQQKGDTIIVGGKSIVLTSDNMITNPSFESGLTGWTDGTAAAAQLSSTYFTLKTTGGINNSQYLVGTSNSGSTSAGSIGTAWPITSGKSYYFSYNVKYQSTTAAAGSAIWLKVSLSNDKTTESFKVIDTSKVNAGGVWTQNAVFFTNSSAYAYIVARFRWLNSLFGFDNFTLHEATEFLNTPGLQKVINEAQSLYNASANGATDLQTAINTAQSKLSSQTGAEILQAISDLKTAIFNYKLANASLQNPLDFTSYITNPSFETDFAGWTNAGMSIQSNAYFPQKDGTYYIEKWVDRGTKVPNVSVQQTLTGIPNGNYLLTATAGNIQQTAASSSINTGNPQTGTMLFAGARSVAVDTIKTHQVRFTVIDNQVIIGLKAENATGNWVTCDNFNLKYIGQYTNSDYASYIGDIVEKAKSYLTKNIQNSVKPGLSSAITNAQQAIGANPLVAADLTAALQGLQSAITVAETSLQTYSTLQSAIDYANLVLGWSSDNQAKHDLLLPAINTATTAVSNYDLTLTEINKATADLNTVVKSVDKQVYIPTWMMGDVTNPDNNWSYSRCKQTKNWILFWEPGYGNNPGSIVDQNLVLAEKCFNFYTDSLKFITRGSSKTDQYKMIIRLRYTTAWEATGSGVDNTIALLTVTSWAATSRGGQTVAHEIGHCFQYQVHCDNGDSNGWLYGFGANASGGNGWWEQCAQWQAYKVFPEQQFTSEWFAGYLSHTNKNLMNETYRYNDYFIQDYWCYLHGMDMIGRLWNKSVKPEDPVETYKRLNNISQSQFNDEMYDCAARFTTWDIPALKSYGASKISSRTQPKLNDVGNNYWMIDSTACLENYGHNIIKLNVPTTAKTISVNFEGLAGSNGFRKNYVSYAGWRFGFVAMKNDGTRIYSEVKPASMSDNGGKVILNFDYPGACTNLWFVVSGAPSSHWRHAWDDDDSNDEQWPYQVKFNNTNLLGYANVVSAVPNVCEENIQIYSNGDKMYINNISSSAIVRIYSLVGSCLLNEKVNSSSFSKILPAGIFIVSVQTENGTFNRKISIR
jgi:hypothetical protein